MADVCGIVEQEQFTTLGTDIGGKSRHSGFVRVVFSRGLLPTYTTTRARFKLLETIFTDKQSRCAAFIDNIDLLPSDQFAKCAWFGAVLIGVAVGTKRL